MSDSPTAAAAAPAPRRITPAQRKQILSACFGTFIEWFDWSLFGLFAIYISGTFFPSENRWLSLAGAGLTFAVAFFMRPLGGWLLGLMADRRGRRPSLILSMVLMTAGSFVIALTPGYAQLGVFGAVILILARVAQGIAAGGDSTNVYVYMAEIAPKGWRNRYAAWTYVFSGASFLLASLIGLAATSWLTTQQMQDYGWRAAFLIGGLVGLIGIVARLKLEETSTFEEVVDAPAAEATQAPAAVQAAQAAHAVVGSPAAPEGRDPHPLWSTLRRHPKAVLQVFGFTMMMTLLYYALTVSFTSYAVDNKGADEHGVFIVTTIGTVVFIALQYPFGWLADRYGRRPQLLIASAVFAVFIVPISLMATSNLVGLFVVFTLCMVIYAPLSSIASVVYADLFPANIVATGLGTWYNIAVAVFGGTVSLVLTGLSSLGLENLFFWYIALASAVGFVSVLSMTFLKKDPKLPPRGAAPALPGDAGDAGAPSAEGSAQAVVSA